jgi:hypothetical protein
MNEHAITKRAAVDSIKQPASESTNACPLFLANFGLHIMLASSTHPEQVAHICLFWHARNSSKKAPPPQPVLCRPL